MPSESILLLGSFALTLFLLIFGSQFLVQTFDLFPADPSAPPTSLRNVLHHAWGSSPSSGINLISKLMSQKSTGDSPIDIQGLLMPVGFAVLIGLGAIVSVFVFGKSKSQYHLHKLLFTSSFLLPMPPQKSQSLTPLTGKSSR